MIQFIVRGKFTFYAPNARHQWHQALPVSVLQLALDICLVQYNKANIALIYCQPSKRYKFPLPFRSQKTLASC